MRTEDEIFDVIKNSPEIKPRKEFVDRTKILLIKEANKYDKKHKILRTSYFWSGFVASLVVITWLSFWGGINYFADSFNQVLAVISLNNKETTPASENNTVKTPVSEEEPSILIYHTHNMESFMPLLNTNEPAFALDDKKNITLVGSELSKSLEGKGIRSIHNKSDIHKMLKDKNMTFAMSYEVTREIIKQTLDEHQNIKLIMDIHRDNSKHEQSTVNINGKRVSRVSFVVSEVSSKFEENLKIAELFHNKLELKYPGISKGIFLSGKETNNTYNQDLLGNSLLIEIGGIENTLKEEYRSTEILSEIIYDVMDEID